MPHPRLLHGPVFAGKQVAYYPVFVQGVDEDETFGNTFEPTPCDGCVFYNATTRCGWSKVHLALCMELAHKCLVQLVQQQT